MHALGAVAVVAACLSSCSASVGGTSTGTSARPPAGQGTTTAPAAGNGKGGSGVTLDQLAQILPTSADVGAGYSIDTTDDSGGGGPSDADIEAAMKKACPDAESLFAQSSTDNGTSADRTFTTDDNRTIDVSYDTSASDPQGINTAAEIEKLVDAINACDTVEVTSDEFSMAMDLRARSDDTYGDRGMVLDIHAKLSGAQLPSGLFVDMRYRIFQVGDVDVAINATSGIDQDTLEVVPADSDIQDRLSHKAETDIAALH